MVRFEGQADISMALVPYADNIELAGWQDNNFVDTLAAAKFRELGIEPSPLCDDATFLRRAFLDAIGTLPTIEQTRAFLDSTDPDKRNQAHRPPAGPDGRSGPGHPQQRVRRLLVAQMVRPDPQHQRQARRAGHVGHAQLDQGLPAGQQAVRQVRLRADHGQRLDLHERPGQLLSHRQQPAGAGGGHRAALPGRAAAVRPVPPSSVREVQPGGILRLRGLLLPAWATRTARSSACSAASRS